MTGDDNTAVGYVAFISNTSGTDNTAIGRATLQSNTTGNFNTAIGERTMLGINGNYNTAIGIWSLSGAGALSATGDYNIAIGAFAMQNNLTGGSNIVIGALTFTDFQAGSNNTIIGYNTLGSINNFDNSTVIGSNMNLGNSLSGIIAIGDGVGNIRIYSDNNGNIGINNLTPLEGLDILGNIVLGNQSIDATRYIGIGSGTSGSFAANSGFSGIELGSPQGAGSGFIAFHTHHYTVDSGERMRIDDEGNVGIGTTSPTYKLQVNNKLNGTAENLFGVFDQNGTTPYFTIASDTNSQVDITSYLNDTTFSINIGGSVGKFKINQASGTNMLQTYHEGGVGFKFDTSVAGTSLETGILNNFTAALGTSGITTWSMAANRISVNSTGTDPGSIYGFYVDKGSWSNTSLSFYPAVFLSGNVGIGTSTPAAILDVNGSLKFGSAGTPGLGKFLTSDAVGNATWQPSNSVTLLRKITADMNTSVDQVIGLTGGNNFVITNIVLTNPSIPLDSLDTVIGTGLSGSFIQGETVNGSISTNYGDVYSATMSTIVLSNNAGGNSMQIGDILTGDISGATMIVSSVTPLTTTYTSGLQIYQSTNRHGIQYIGGNSNLGYSVLQGGEGLLLPNNYFNQNSIQGGSTITNTLYLSITTPQGAAATLDVYVYGFILS
jgi:hypothetical protein